VDTATLQPSHGIKQEYNALRKWGEYTYPWGGSSSVMPCRAASGRDRAWIMPMSSASVVKGSDTLSGSLVALTARASSSGRRATTFAAVSTFVVSGILGRK